MTPESTNVPYLSAAELIDRADVRNLLMLATDDNTPAAAGDLATSPTLAACLIDATGDIESACVVGARYAPADLAAIAASGTAAGARLKRLAADLAVYYLFKRRAVDIPRDVLDDYDRAERALGQLSAGEKMFPTVENLAASVPTNQYMDRQDFCNQGLLSNNTRYFGLRENRKRPY